MDASNWINLGLLVVAIVAALFAAFQVVEARKARSDAVDAKEAAAKYEEAALAASEKAANSAQDSAESQRRIAKATEQQAEYAEVAADAQKPWSFEALTAPKGEQRWQIVNRTNKMIVGASLSAMDPENSQWLRVEHLSGPLLAGQAIHFTFERDNPESPAELAVRFEWTSEDMVNGATTYTLR